MTYYFNSTDNKATNNNTNYKIDLSKYYITEKKKDYTDNILDTIKSIFPWTKKNNMFNYTMTISDLPSTKEYTILNIDPLLLNLEWNKAASRIYDYMYYTDNPTYDFKIGNIPVKIHGNYIQVGAKLIPTFTSSSFFNTYTPEERTIIYNISLEINALIAA